MKFTVRELRKYKFSEMFEIINRIYEKEKIPKNRYTIRKFIWNNTKTQCIEVIEDYLGFALWYENEKFTAIEFLA